jgi:hypothetical protein
MKNKKILFLLTVAVLAIAGLVINSCKKDNQNSVETLLTRGKWQLASVMVYNFVGSSQVGTTDTLNGTCDSTQIFTFNTNNTCGYTNFECIAQKTSGNWTLSSDQLTLISNMLCTDTLIGGKIDSVKRMPFQNTKIINLGQYSLVLETGDVNTFYTSTTKRRIVEYGFVHQVANTQ